MGYIIIALGLQDKF